MKTNQKTLKFLKIECYFFSFPFTQHQVAKTKKEKKIGHNYSMKEERKEKMRKIHSQKEKKNGLYKIK